MPELQPHVYELTFTTNLVDGSQIPECTMKVRAWSEDAAKEKLERHLTNPETDQRPPIQFSLTQHQTGRVEGLTRADLDYRFLSEWFGVVLALLPCWDQEEPQ